MNHNRLPTSVINNATGYFPTIRSALYLPMTRNIRDRMAPMSIPSSSNWSGSVIRCHHRGSHQLNGAGQYLSRSLTSMGNLA